MENCKDAVNAYVDYWNDWHKDWYKNSTSNPTNLSPIKNWDVPPGKGGNAEDIWRYFPEPYWGNTVFNELSAVFLNLNPGGGNDSQDILSANKSFSNLYNTYDAQNHFYSKTVQNLIKDCCYVTTNWFIKKRVKWLNDLMHSLKKVSNHSIEQILCADLIPWHTPSINQIAKYIADHQKLIIEFVIKPITDISQCAQLKGLIFAKGAEIEHVLERIPIQPVVYEKESYRISIFEYNNAKIIVCVGGQGMHLPDASKTYLSPKTNKEVSVSEIVEGCLKGIYV
jgi:hypothetical protein